MFEVGVISIVVLAVGYWVTLWLMGRHDDVLHGDFVHAEEGPDSASVSAISLSGPSAVSAEAGDRTSLRPPDCRVKRAERRFPQRKSRRRRQPVLTRQTRCKRCWRPSSGDLKDASQL